MLNILEDTIDILSKSIKVFFRLHLLPLITAFAVCYLLFLFLNYISTYMQTDSVTYLMYILLTAILTFIALTLCVWSVSIYSCKNVFYSLSNANIVIAAILWLTSWFVALFMYFVGIHDSGYFITFSAAIIILVGFGLGLNKYCGIKLPFISQVACEIKDFSKTS